MYKIIMSEVIINIVATHIILCDHSKCLGYADR